MRPVHNETGPRAGARGPVFGQDVPVRDANTGPTRAEPGPNRTGAGPDRAGPDWAGPDWAGPDRGRGRTGYFFLAPDSSLDRTAMKASCGTSTEPTIFIRFLPSFCFSSSFRLREMSPP